MKTIIFLCLVLLSQGLLAQPKPLNSFDKIAQALGLKKITEAEAHGLKVLAFMDIVHLPSEYQPDPGAPAISGDLQLRAAIKFLPQMSGTLASYVYQLLIPEPFRPSAVGLTNSIQGDFPDPRFYPSTQWKFVDHTIANIRVWYETDDPTKEALAIKIKDILGDKVIEPTRRLMGRTHPADDDINRTLKVRLGLEKTMPNGGDGKLDVYLGVISKAANARAAVFPYALKSSDSLGCLATASYMTVDLGFARSAPESHLMTTLAHEYFHTIQNSYNRKSECHTYDNSDEGTATYIKHHFFPSLNHEHEWFEYFEDGPEPFANADYGTWVFYLYLVQSQGERTIRDLYEKEELYSDLDAINAVLKGGWKEGWPEFALYNWNQDPLQDNFVRWDKFPFLPGRGALDAKGHKPPIKIEEVSLDLNGTFRSPFRLQLKPLTRDFYAFDFSGQDIRSVSIDNPILFAAKKARAKVMIVKSNGQSVEEFVWEDSKRHVYQYCLDNPSERIEKIVIAVTNYNHKVTGPVYNFEGAVKATNIGCYKYQGRARAQLYASSPKSTVYLDVQASDVVMKAKGRNDEGFFGGHFNLEKGVITYNYRGQSDGCVGNASGNLLIDTGPSVIALNVYPYNVPPDASGTYAFILQTKERTISVKYTCPAPLPSYEVSVPVDIQSLGEISHNGFDHFSGKASKLGWTVEWDFAPVKE